MTPPPEELARYYDVAMADAAEPPTAALARLTSGLVRQQGRYLDLRPLARGGCKEVFRARDRYTGREVAVAFPVGWPDDIANALRFLREARITARLEHPNIMPVYDMGVDDAGRPYFTMKLVRGESLAMLLGRLDTEDPEALARYGLPQRLRLFRSVAEAAAHAHDQGVVHRDLTPGNVLVGERGEVLVCDWGLAKTTVDRDDVPGVGYPGPYSKDWNPERDDPSIPSLAGQIKGTPGFMSPEQAGARAAEVDERTDVYLLGCLLYALLTFKPPYLGRTVEEMLQQARTGALIPPRKRCPYRRIPRTLEAMALKALSPEPSGRYERVAQLMEDLNRYEEDRLTLAEGGSRFRRAQLFARRNRPWLAGLLAVALPVAALTGYLRLEQAGRKRQAHQQEQALLRAEALRMQAQKALGVCRPDDALPLVEEALSLDPDNQGALILRATLSFVQQDFEAAARLFGSVKAVDFRYDMIPLSTKYAALKGNAPRLDPQHLSELLDDLIDDEREHLFLALLKRARDDYPVDVLASFVRRLLEHMNPRQQQWHWDFQRVDGKNHLSLAGNRNLTDLDALLPLELHSLDLSGTGVSDDWVVREINPAVFRFEDTPLAD